MSFLASVPFPAPIAVPSMMAGRQSPESQPPRPPSDGSADGPPGGGSNAGWTLFSYLISGMAFYGAVGWLIGRWTHVALLFPLGMLVGLLLAIVLIIYKYGRS
jgi:ATP synthase protein I